MKMTLGTPWPTANTRRLEMTADGVRGCYVGDKVRVTTTGETGTIEAMTPQSARVVFADGRRAEYGFGVISKR